MIGKIAMLLLFANGAFRSAWVVFLIRPNPHPPNTATASRSAPILYSTNSTSTNNGFLNVNEWMMAWMDLEKTTTKNFCQFNRQQLILLFIYMCVWRRKKKWVSNYYSIQNTRKKTMKKQRNYYSYHYIQTTHKLEIVDFVCRFLFFFDFTIHHYYIYIINWMIMIIEYDIKQQTNKYALYLSTQIIIIIIIISSNTTTKHRIERSNCRFLFCFQISKSINQWMMMIHYLQFTIYHWFISLINQTNNNQNK